MPVLAAVVLCALPAAGGVFAGVAARDPQLDGLAERLAVAAGQALEKAGYADLGSPPLPDPDDAPDAVLKSALDDARARYLEGDFAGALQRATDAATRFEESGAFRPGDAWKSYADALVLSSVALRRLGKDGDADEALRRLAATAPTAKLDPDITPKKTAERWAELVAELWRKPRVQIEVVSTPPGALVSIDGKAAGTAPVVVGELLPGAHFVGVSADGERRERRVAVTSGSVRLDVGVGDARVTPALKLREALAAPIGAQELAAKATALGDDVVVGALVSDPGGALFVLARHRAGELSVVGARVGTKADAKARAGAVVAALAKGEGGWLQEGPASPLVVLTKPRSTWATGADGPRSAVLEDDQDRAEGGLDGWLVAGVGASVLVVAAAATITGVVLAAGANNRVTVTVDASKL